MHNTAYWPNLISKQSCYWKATKLVCMGKQMFLGLHQLISQDVMTGCHVSRTHSCILTYLRHPHIPFCHRLSQAASLSPCLNKISRNYLHADALTISKLPISKNVNITLQALYARALTLAEVYFLYWKLGG